MKPGGHICSSERCDDGVEVAFHDVAGRVVEYGGQVTGGSPVVHAQPDVVFFHKPNLWGEGNS